MNPLLVYNTARDLILEDILSHVIFLKMIKCRNYDTIYWIYTNGGMNLSINSVMKPSIQEKINRYVANIINSVSLKFLIPFIVFWKFKLLSF